MSESKELKINISPEKAQGVFANLALIAHTPTEFVFDFAQLLPGSQQPDGTQQATVVSRVIVTPDQARKFLNALQSNVGQYESKYGPIMRNGGPTKGSTLPLTFTGGEA